MGRRYVSDRRKYVAPPRRPAPTQMRVRTAIEQEEAAARSLERMSQTHAAETRKLQAEIAALTRENLRLKDQLAFMERHGNRS